MTTEADRYADAMGEEAKEMSDRWRSASGKLDVHAETSRVTLRIVGRLLFGADVERAVPVVGRGFPILGEYARMRAYNPLPPPRGWPTPANRRAAQAREEIRRVCDELIAAPCARARPRGPSAGAAPATARSAGTTCPAARRCSSARR